MVLPAERKVPGASEVVARPASGRVFDTRRRVRYGDVDSTGAIRLDAVARYIQDVAGDDTTDAGPAHGGATWVVRRTLIEVVKPLVAWEPVEVATWCGGVGSHWAERVVTLRGERGGDVRTASIWVAVDLEGLRPARIPQSFVDTYAAAAQGRRVSAPLVLAPQPPADTESTRWTVRHTDIDVLGHANNAIAWAMVEEALARSGHRLGKGSSDRPCRAEVEFREPVLGSDDVTLHWTIDDDGLHVWAVADVDGRPICRVAARVAPVRPASGAS